MGGACTGKKRFQGAQMNLEGKLAVVTGASSGIGASTAYALAERGARVALVARNEERLEQVAQRIRAPGGEASVFVADLGDPAAIRELARRVLEGQGVPDLLVNNAGAGRWLSVLETSAADAAEMLAVPYLGAFNLTREFLPAMLERRSGRIVNVTSVATRLAWPGATAYIAARRAMEGFDAGLGAELLGTGLSSLLVVLGTVDSPYWEHNPGSRERLPPPRGIRALTPEEAAAVIVSAIERDQRRLVKPAAFQLLFLWGALFPGAMDRMLALPPHAPLKEAAPRALP
jgi:short-subunit dehydrogenase